ncbi:DUF378 domain-containing protein [Agrobacterium radiobacter]|jgi:uncharacterized membrane protein YuzA (DUF378 family)|nr:MULTISPECIES: DUF378 domain-containing protein [Agrobacterium]KWT87581.1 hypothetical protein ASB65_20515 [Agrobacterium tumefaciens str. B6]MBP2511010.1 uncharacterized membrane protein YuzA (DUF378 family) [Agrobacterium tumefaciens]MBP2520235.1 uncharacterized membrane protein YuzA (DUF378 family) [Agrobacterium tumefaciens]MBP2570447.1 uncharacterized membrane protein YuzA (DUF378 family) [Agrobacterium tumefaciens]MBP2578905.1 uncharacterized membrane protein YuzA (DUF378 family) [Agro
MRILNTITLLLIVIGGLDWLLIGLFQFDPIGLLLGGPGAILARIIYTLIGVSALWQLLPLFGAVARRDAEAKIKRSNVHRP